MTPTLARKLTILLWLALSYNSARATPVISAPAREANHPIRALGGVTNITTMPISKATLSSFSDLVADLEIFAAEMEVLNAKMALLVGISEELALLAETDVGFMRP
jgi:hypothetical protein